MRKRIPYRVCSCTPLKGIVQIEARLLAEMVNREMRRIKCMHDLRRKAQRAISLGDICVHSHHPYWALKVYKWTSRNIQDRDWDEWFYEDWKSVGDVLENLTSQSEARQLGRRADDVWRWLGHPEMTGWERSAEANYQFMFIAKYNADLDCFFEIVDTPDPSVAIFNEGLPYCKPLFTQDIFEQ